MLNRTPLEQLREIPAEWHRRGLTSPAELAEIVTARVNAHPVAVEFTSEPTYADFFTAPAA